MAIKSVIGNRWAATCRIPIWAIICASGPLARAFFDLHRVEHKAPIYQLRETENASIGRLPIVETTLKGVYGSREGSRSIGWLGLSIQRRLS